MNQDYKSLRDKIKLRNYMDYEQIVDELGKFNLNRDYPHPDHYTKLVNFFYKLHKSNDLDLGEVRKAIDVLTNTCGKNVMDDIEDISYYISLLRLY